MIKVEQRTVVIKPNKVVKFAGVSSFPNTGQSFETAQLSKTGYKTGLTKQEEEEFEVELGLPKGTLNRGNEAFWSQVPNIRLPNDRDTYYQVVTLMDEIKLRALLENSRIAKNQTLLKSNPSAEFYVQDLEAVAKETENKVSVKWEAIDALRSLSLEEKKGFLKLYGSQYRGLDSVSETYVNGSLSEEVDKNPNRFLTLFKNPDIKIMISVENMIDAGTLTKNGQYYKFENEIIGSSIEQVVIFFKNPRNQSIKFAATEATKKGKNKE
jgi:hypothetical protein